MAKKCIYDSCNHVQQYRAKLPLVTDKVITKFHQIQCTKIEDLCTGIAILDHWPSTSNTAA